MKEQTKNTEIQINEEKIQESINKDLEELNKHTETNSTITEIKNTLEGIKTRIFESEEQISELEDKMMEITSEEQNKVKRMWGAEDSFRDVWGHIRHISDTFQLQESQKKKWKRKNFFLRDYGWKFPQHGKRNSQSSPRGTKSPIQDKPKEKHAKKHTNQTNKN